MEINDDFIIKFFINDNGKLNSRKLSENYLSKYPDIKQYLSSRFSDYDNYSEVIFRIVNKIEIRPIYHHCGNRVKFYKFSKGFQKFCSMPCKLAKNDPPVEEPDYSDELVFSILQHKSGCYDKNKITTKYFSSHPKFKAYLDSRYPDSESMSETLFRMKNHIEIRPTCKQCGNPVNFQGNCFSTFCCPHCAAINEDTIKKFQETCLKNYGSTHMWSNQEVRQKCHETSLDLYGNLNNHEQIKATCLANNGVEFPLQNSSIYQKMETTNLSKYGSKCVFSSEQIQNKISNILLETIGVDNPFKSPSIREEISKTIFDTYGQSCPLSNGPLRDKGKETQRQKYDGLLYIQTQDFKDYMSSINDVLNDKKYKTRKKNNSFNSSSIEEKFNCYLTEHFPNDFIRQYKDPRYPFHCDFYVKSLDLFIEIQGFYTHGPHPFDHSNEEDLDLLSKFKDKNYQNIIDIWTVSDPNKRKIAKQNNLNYLEIFSCDINNCISQLNNFIKQTIIFDNKN